MNGLWKWLVIITYEFKKYKIISGHISGHIYASAFTLVDWKQFLLIFN